MDGMATHATLVRTSDIEEDGELRDRASIVRRNRGFI
jgi:hypothetical protein